MNHANNPFPEMSTANISAGRRINTAKFWQTKSAEATEIVKAAEFKLKIAKNEVLRAKRREAEIKKKAKKTAKAAAN